MVTAGIVVDLHQAIFILYGFNVGTVVTTLLASLRGNKTAKRAAMVHVWFNIIGALIFTVLTVLPFGFVSLIQNTSENIALQLVYAHIVFNVATLFILLPLSRFIIALAEKSIKNTPDGTAQLKLKFIDRRLLHTPEIEVEHILKEIQRTFELVQEDFVEGTNVQSVKKDNIILTNETLINYLVREINRTLVNLNTVDLKDSYAISVGRAYKIINYLAQIEACTKDIALTLKDYDYSEEEVDKEKNELAIKLVMEAIVPLIERMLNRVFMFFKDKKYQEEETILYEIEKLEREIFNLTQVNRDLLRADFEDIRILNNLRKVSTDILHIVEVLDYKV